MRKNEKNIYIRAGVYIIKDERIVSYYILNLDTVLRRALT